MRTGISTAWFGFQPVPMCCSQHWLPGRVQLAGLLTRDQRPDGRVTVVRTQDGGQQWRDLPDLALSNPDASTAAIALAPGQLWLVFNSSVHSRQVLDLSHSVDGKAGN